MGHRGSRGLRKIEIVRLISFVRSSPSMLRAGRKEIDRRRVNALALKSSSVSKYARFIAASQSRFLNASLAASRSWTVSPANLATVEPAAVQGHGRKSRVWGAGDEAERCVGRRKGGGKDRRREGRETVIERDRTGCDGNGGTSKQTKRVSIASSSRHEGRETATHRHDRRKPQRSSSSSPLRPCLPG